MNPRQTKLGFYAVKLYSLGYIIYQVFFNGSKFINVDGAEYEFSDIQYFYEE